VFHLDSFIWKLKRWIFSHEIEYTFSESILSVFEIPSIFIQSWGNNSSHVINMSVREFLTLVRAGNSTINDLSHWVRNVERKLIPLDSTFMITIKYSKIESPWYSTNQWLPLLFRNSKINFTSDPVVERTMQKEIMKLQEVNEKFESYLCAATICQRVKKWRDIIILYEYNMFLSVVSSTNMISPFVHNRRLERDRLFHLLETKMKIFLKSQLPNIEHLTSIWKTIIKVSYHKFNLREFFSRAILTSSFCMIVDQLKNADINNLSLTFTMILRIVRTLKLLANYQKCLDQELFNRTIIMLQSPTFSEFYLIISKFAIETLIFQLFCPPKTKSLVLFEKVMLTFIISNPTLATLFFSIQTSLESKRKINESFRRSSVWSIK